MPFLHLQFFAVVQLDVGHPVYQLYQVALVVGQVLEPLGVYLPALLQEKHRPAYVQRRPYHECAEQRSAEVPYQSGIDHKEQDRDAGTHDGIRHEGLDAVVVADALHDVSCIPCLEKGNGQPCEFGKEAVDERDADERSALQREPSAQQVVAQLPQGEHQLGKQHQRNDIQVFVADATIHHVLRKERQRHAEEAAYGHGSQYAEQRLGMWQHMLEQVGPGELHFVLAVQPSECFGRCQYQGMSSPSLLLLPVLQELLAAVVQESVCRVYHHGLLLPAPQVLADAGEHHKVVSPPVHDARFLHLLQFLPRQAEGTSLHPELFRRRLQFEERGTLMAASGHLLHGSGREVLAVVAEDDAEAGGSAIGMIMLFVKMVFGHNIVVISRFPNGCFLPSYRFRHGEPWTSGPNGGCSGHSRQW